MSERHEEFHRISVYPRSQFIAKFRGSHYLRIPSYVSSSKFWVRSCMYRHDRRGQVKGSKDNRLHERPGVQTIRQGSEEKKKNQGICQLHRDIMDFSWKYHASRDFRSTFGNTTDIRNRCTNTPYSIAFRCMVQSSKSTCSNSSNPHSTVLGRFSRFGLGGTVGGALECMLRLVDPPNSGVQ